MNRSCCCREPKASARTSRKDRKVCWVHLVPTPCRYCGNQESLQKEWQPAQKSLLQQVCKIPEPKETLNVLLTCFSGFLCPHGEPHDEAKLQITKRYSHVNCFRVLCVPGFSGDCSLREPTMKRLELSPISSQKDFQLTERPADGSSRDLYNSH